MNTTDIQLPGIQLPGAGRRRGRYSDDFKCKVVDACAQPGVSTAAVALANGLNANLLRRWISESRIRAKPAARQTKALAIPAQTQFIPVQLEDGGAAPAVIHIELQRAGTTVRVQWPAACADSVRCLDARSAQMIRIDAVWLASAPMDMRAGIDTALARVVTVFGAAHPHTAYLFANQRGNRIKVLVHDGIGLWLVARRLHQGRFVWAAPDTANCQLERVQFDALVLGLPWQRMGRAGSITMV